VFFVSTLLLVFIVLVSAVLKTRWRNLLVYAASVICITGIIVSATALPIWFYSVWTAVFGLWIIALNLKAPSFQRPAFLIRSLLTATCIIAMFIELPYHLKPAISVGDYKIIYVIGDSVSAGLGGKRFLTWPELLGQAHGVTVKNLAEAGATVGTALKQIKNVEEANAIVIIEIGGNDILSVTPTPAAQFEASLGKMITDVSGAGRQVAMFELPLLPLQNEYGRIQRRIARTHNVTLIPKRYFVGVLCSTENTSDLIHLSKKGHEVMAAMVWSIISPLCH
jgi:lysophospholipase L1-like esterase